MSRRPPLSFDLRLAAICLLGGAPGLLLALALLWEQGASGKALWTAALVLGGCLVAAASSVRERVLRPLQAATNLLAAVREGDFSVRGNPGARGDPLADLMSEINQLSAALREQRLGSIEASALLTKVLEAIDVAVLAFDPSRRVALANAAAQRQLGIQAPVGMPAQLLHIDALLEGPFPRIEQLALPGGSGRFELRSATFRLGGVPHTLLLMADVGRALREEERSAWQRLVRVLGHEINNSLAPVRSIAGSLREEVEHELRPDSLKELQSGLTLIERRCDGLSRFLSGYAHLARLPPPHLASVEVGPLLQQAASLERRRPVQVRPGPVVRVRCDADQLTQALINLIKNGADAALETSGEVDASWEVRGPWVDLTIRDEGPGVAQTSNLFVPFFTTKPEGTGIGLALSRQIAEAHGGTLTLESRPDRSGAVARLTLPLASEEASPP